MGSRKRQKELKRKESMKKMGGGKRTMKRRGTKQHLLGAAKGAASQKRRNSLADRLEMFKHRQAMKAASEATSGDVRARVKKKFRSALTKLSVARAFSKVPRASGPSTVSTTS